jgi:hypothetical protein
MAQKAPGIIVIFSLHGETRRLVVSHQLADDIHDTYLQSKLDPEFDGDVIKITGLYDGEDCQPATIMFPRDDWDYVGFIGLDKYAGYGVCKRALESSCGIQLLGSGYEVGFRPSVAETDAETNEETVDDVEEVAQA